MDQQKEVLFTVGGMHCAACSSRLERVLNGMDGVQSATVSLAANSATVVPDPALSESDTEALVHQIEERAVDMGFTATPVAPEADMVDTWEAQQKETVGQLATLKARLWPEFGFTILLLLVSMGHMWGLPLPAIIDPMHSPESALNHALLQLVLTLPVLWSGRHFYLTGLPNLWRLTPNMDSLVAMGTGAAFLYSLWNTVEVALGHTGKVMDLYYESAAEERNLHLYPVSDFASVSGLGVSGNVDLENESIPLLLGNKRLMEERQVSFDAVKDLDARLAELSDSGATPLLLAVNGRLVGMLAVADTIRPETAGVVKELRQLGLRVIMLSGDNRRTAEAIAKSAGIDEVIADVLPDGKEKVLSELQAAGLRVGMIGDGINDAPALARADVGMAMGNGIDVAVEAGDIVLLGSDTRSGKGLRGVMTALELSRAALRNIRENLGWAFGYNILCLPIAAGVLKIFGGPSLSPMIAGAAMAFSSVSVVLNALRLRRFGK